MKIQIRGLKKNVTGTAQQPDFVGSALLLKHEYEIIGESRGDTNSETVTIEANDVVQLEFGGDEPVTWMCGEDTIGDLFHDQVLQRDINNDVELVLPATIHGPANERGIVQQIAIKAIKIFSKNAVGAGVKALAKKFEEKELGVSSNTLFRVSERFEMLPFAAEVSDKPYLLFLHGTASSANGSFDSLRPQATGRNTGIWRYMCDTYGKNILAFQHRTLTESPLQNVLDLVNQLPVAATLHLISHSRGGLVGDVLSRFCIASQEGRGFSQRERDLLNKSGRTADDECIGKIFKALETRRIVVSKFIRVACPAAGTILASERLDHFFNIAGNLLRYSVTSALFRELLAAIINTKNDVDVLPGLEAMDPESPFIKALNNRDPEASIDTSLAVIAGNCKPGFNLGALAVIAGRLFFQRNNDLIVNTNSMYQGALRTDPLQYYFDEQTDVNHFHYFRNERTQDALLAALKHTGTGTIQGFNVLQPHDEQLQRNIAKLEGGQVFMDNVTGKRPIAIILPGIMGSNLRVNDKLLWINYIKMVGGRLEDLAMTGDNNVTAPSLVRTSYLDLANHLSDTYDVVTFPFDWRQPLTDSADLLNKKIEALMKFGQPIKIVAHSMGGVLMRDFIVKYHDTTWKSLNNLRDFKLVFLGTPLGGSFRIATVLFGQDDIINKISMLDLMHGKKDLIDIFNKFSGLLDLLPFTSDAGLDLGKMDTWQAMRNATGDADWPLPNEEQIKKFDEYRTKARNAMASIDFSNAVYVAGKSDATPCGFRIDKKSQGQELVFLYTGAGDQSVTWETGIPAAMIAKGSVYYADVSHGALSCHKSMLPAIADILQKGSTSLLKKTRPETRSFERVFRAPQISDLDYSEAGVVNTLLGIGVDQLSEVSADEVISASVSNGELRYASHPVLIGHFNGDGILYAEKAVDKQLGGLLTRRHSLGLHPGVIGASEVVMPFDGEFPGTIVVGLGEAGKLTEFQLSKTVERGVINYLLYLDANKNSLENYSPEKLSGISSLAIGCGYGGLTIENSLRAILEGVRNANRKVKIVKGDDARIIKCVEFVEKYEDNALHSFYSLHRIESENSSLVTIRPENRKIRSLIGLQRRFPKDETQQWWSRINVSTEVVETNPAVGKKEAASIKKLRFSASTGAAREDQRELYSNTGIVKTLIDEISVDSSWTKETAQTLFELMIPADFKDQLKRQSHINWILDKDSASYPWELLHDGVTGGLPLAVSSGMVRQLASKNARTNTSTVAKNSALVIADPDLQQFAPQLPAAAEEGKIVAAIIASRNYDVTSCFPNVPAVGIIKKLFADSYKIIHIAAHGTFNPEQPDQSGIVIGKNIFLSTRELAQMGSVPELVFINCCYTGKIDGNAEQLYRDRYKLAANIGTQLIENGARAVVATGWAVNDAAAKEFSEVFYNCMFAGESFGVAVLKARKHIYKEYGDCNTWGAYQCYGDPFYKLVNSEDEDNEAFLFATAAEAEVELFNLLNKLDLRKRGAAESVKSLNEISAAITPGIRTTRITELEGLILSELMQYDAAIGKFEEVFRAEDANFNFSTIEKYFAVHYKQYMAEYYAADPNSDLATFAADLRKKLDDLAERIQITIDFAASSERYYLLGSTYRRKAMLCEGSEKLEALAEASLYYYKGYKQKATCYTYINWLETECMLVRAGERAWGTEVSYNGEKYRLPSLGEAWRALDDLRANVMASGSDLSYWDVMARIYIDICVLVIGCGTPVDSEDRWKRLATDFVRIWSRTGSPLKKLSAIERLEFLLYTLNSINAETNFYRSRGEYNGDIKRYLAEIETALKVGFPVRTEQPVQ